MAAFYNPLRPQRDFDKGFLNGVLTCGAIMLVAFVLVFLTAKPEGREFWLTGSYVPLLLYPVMIIVGAIQWYNSDGREQGKGFVTAVAVMMLINSGFCVYTIKI